ncbi:hypothetical protein AUEXF2481DRAFT_44640 [Aureobasidium subglaciale EXF-2481]|uniref:DUF427 domain-containing protein n=1 Tax=Aureobasidium subglaciale (strain EXF-2481) TaxID=1043005 RepID=A0A074Y4K9_AURSE|nr:uncharacterized protein AUEXF2481DRAFT_44640 [Aureobasidium subglaciale EXF-2481]KAI5205308.1 DUF427-domain-containing protein [Aureobasidium subglaciale]KAI5224180.1 DUF427-domain-containing protein [Aureobasidium subglaciale]KAI5228277.1 DUF427-domain-containing protein [Aureobasidium subglaciale]KAI5262848.1 DUF427-domain-containing protein [Aureobasidium subglaciale]KEQ90904.1 hypothetical protein AUEXF2481DRAFT_44640 [Aureobasidium subglaciale EXF-2481]
MALPGREVDLPTLARHLVEHGPHKTLSTERRVRVLINGACIADSLGTTGALFVWEHPHYPQLYFPRDALVKNVSGYNIIYEDHQDVKSAQDKVIAKTLKVKVQRNSDNDMKEIKDGFMVFDDKLDGKASALSGMLKINFSAGDQWLEEDTPMFVHPKDPFKRLDILQSSRSVRVAVDGKTIAESQTCMQLYETGLPVRYYMPLTSIDTSLLRPSDTITACPYKGEASYYNVVVGDRTHKDIIWYYNHPIVECAAITGLCCFYNEKVDMWVQNGDEWKKLEKANSIFS